MEKILITEFESYGREPIIRRMKDGSLICMFLTGGATEPRNDNVVSASYSYDDGCTWTKPVILFNHNCRGMWCTEIFNEDEYPFAAVYTYHADCHYRELQTYCSESRDNGKTWSEPKSFPGQLNGCSLRQGITLSNGDVLFPLYWQETWGDFEWTSSSMFGNSWKFCCGVGIRHKGKKDWKRYGYLVNDEFPLWEPNAVEVSPGHIIMYLRNRSGYLYYSESFDYGHTWTDAKKSDILNSDTKVTLLKVKNKILMINNAVATGRTHLEISGSDDGLDFTHICYIEDKESRWFYPHAFADDEKKMLYVAYENAKLHYLAKISYEELGI